MHKTNSSIAVQNKTLKQAEPVCKVIHTDTPCSTKNGMSFAGKIYKALENAIYPLFEQKSAPKKASK